VTTSIDRLASLMPPPTEPTYPGSRAEWESLQKKLGLQFPEDYYSLLNAYGSGRFLAGEFKVANPFDPGDSAFADVELRTLRDRRDNAASEVPYPLFPEPGGLYPFGIDGNGNTFLWLTQGKSETWPIACFNSEDYSELVKHRLPEFLILLATNRLRINRRKFWGSDFSGDQLEFIPRPPRRKRTSRV
jgi:hypothetical protein